MRVRRVVLVALPVAAASATLILLPPTLAQVAVSPLDSDSVISVGPAEAGAGFASVSVSAGWIRTGTGPFAPGDRASLVSPDGVYRVELEIVGTPSDSPHSPGEDGLAVPGDAASRLRSRLETAAWSTETLASGNDVRYASLVDGANTVTVAVVAPPGGTLASPDAGTASPEPVRLLLVATAPARDAARY